MIGQASGHRWRNPQRLVNPAKVIVQEVNRHHRGVILDLFAERIGYAFASSPNIKGVFRVPAYQLTTP
jgi:hypothetical protein